jgi:hypothetical protein
MNGIEGYGDFLKRRDGEADLLNRRLANREDFFSSLETNPVRSVHPPTGRRFCGTCAAADPSRAWTARCCSCWPPPS